MRLRISGPLVLNTALALLVAGGSVGAYTTIHQGATTTVAARTATVQRGIVQSSVSATGNVKAATALSVGFQTSGTITEIDVTNGQQVNPGDVLARLDPSAAQSTLAVAQMTLASAQARSTVLAGGETAAQRQQDALSAQQAQMAVTTAQTGLANERAVTPLNAEGYQNAVNQASQQLSHDQQQQTTDAGQLSSDQSRLATDQQALQSCQSQQNANCSTQQQQVTTDGQAVTADTGKVSADAFAVTKDQQALQNAQLQQRQGLLKDQQALAQAQQQVASAQLSYQATLAGISVKQTPATADQLDSAQATILADQAQVATDQKALADTTLTAPSAGVVSALTAVVGQSVTGSGVSPSSAGGASTTGSGSGTASSSSSSGSGSSALLSLTDVGTLEVTAGFSEADAANIRAGQTANVTFQALSNQSVAGKVVQVDATATVVSNVVEYTVTISLASAPAGLKPGETANATVVTGEHDNVLYVPSAAVRAAGPLSTVTVDAGGTSSAVRVTTGLVGDTTTEVLTGLTAGQQVEITTATAGAGGATGAGGALGGGGAGLGGAVRLGG